LCRNFLVLIISAATVECTSDYWPEALASSQSES
jgi:hypothetical protein